MEKFEGTLEISFEALDVQEAESMLRWWRSNIHDMKGVDSTSAYLEHHGSLLKDQPERLLRNIRYEVI